MKTSPFTSTRLSRHAFLRACMCGLPLTPALILTGQTVQSPAAPPKLDLGNLRAFVELARSDLRTQKALVVAQNMDFNEAEAVEFWPLHREYDGEGNKLLDQRYELIVRFARNYQSMTDAEAAELATKAFALESKRTDLKRKYFKKFRNVVPARKAARFFQIEHQLNMALDLQLAASLPLIK